MGCGRPERLAQATVVRGLASNAAYDDERAFSRFVVNAAVQRRGVRAATEVERGSKLPEGGVSLTLAERGGLLPPSLHHRARRSTSWPLMASAGTSIKLLARPGPPGHHPDRSATGNLREAGSAIGPRHARNGIETAPDALIRSRTGPELVPNWSRGGQLFLDFGGTCSDRVAIAFA
jgi:hypothetical protein